MPYQKFAYQQECLKQGEILPVQDQYGLNPIAMYASDQQRQKFEESGDLRSIEPADPTDESQFLMTDNEFVKKTFAKK